MKHWRDHLQPRPSPDVSAWRLFNGSGFHWSGVWIENFDGRWLVQTKKERFPEALKVAVDEGVADSIYWKVRAKSAKGAPEWVAGEVVSEPFEVEENGLKFLVDFSAGYSQGIFLDQRENRKRVMERVRPGERVLNCFSYTGAFSVAAAAAGGISTSLDLSNPYLEWGKDNLKANGIDPEAQFFCKGDAFKWLDTFHRQERRFRGVILDPPTFSRNEKGKVFRAEKHYADLVALACGVLEEEGWILCTGNTHHLDVRHFERLVQNGVKRGRRIAVDLVSYPMPSEYGKEDYLKTCWVSVA